MFFNTPVITTPTMNSNILPIQPKPRPNTYSITHHHRSHPYAYPSSIPHLHDSYFHGQPMDQVDHSNLTRRTYQSLDNHTRSLISQLYQAGRPISFIQQVFTIFNPHTIQSFIQGFKATGQVEKKPRGGNRKAIITESIQDEIIQLCHLNPTISPNQIYQQLPSDIQDQISFESTRRLVAKHRKKIESMNNQVLIQPPRPPLSQSLLATAIPTTVGTDPQISFENDSSLSSLPIVPSSDMNDDAVAVAVAAADDDELPKLNESIQLSVAIDEPIVSLDKKGLPVVSILSSNVQMEQVVHPIASIVNDSQPHPTHLLSSSPCDVVMNDIHTVTNLHPSLLDRTIEEASSPETPKAVVRPTKRKSTRPTKAEKLQTAQAIASAHKSPPPISSSSTSSPHTPLIKIMRANQLIKIIPSSSTTYQQFHYRFFDRSSQTRFIDAWKLCYEIAIARDENNKKKGGLLSSSQQRDFGTLTIMDMLSLNESDIPILNHALKSAQTNVSNLRRRLKKFCLKQIRLSGESFNDKDLSVTTLSLLSTEPGRPAQEPHFDAPNAEAAQQQWVFLFYLMDSISTAVGEFTQIEREELWNAGLSEERMKKLFTGRFFIKRVRFGDFLMFRGDLCHFGPPNNTESNRAVLFCVVTSRDVTSKKSTTDNTHVQAQKTFSTKDLIPPIEPYKTEMKELVTSL